MRRGMLSSFDEAQEALDKLIELGEQKFSSVIEDVVVGIAGSHLVSEVVSVECFHPHPSVINMQTIQGLELQAKNKNKNKEKEIIHIIPIRYCIDDRTQTKNPQRFNFNKLTGDFFIIKADKLYLLDIIRLCNHSGLRIRKLYAEPFASASIVLDNSTKEHGVAITDIGGGTTDGIIFQGGEPLKVFTLNIGGKIITNDLALGLGLSFAEAEHIKTTHGLISSEKNTYIQAKNIHNNTSNINPQIIYNILGSRIAELSQLIKIEIQSQKIYTHPKTTY